MNNSPSQVYVWEDFYFGVFSSGTYRNESKVRISVFIALDDGSIQITPENEEQQQVTHAVVKRSQPIIIHSDCDFIALQYFPVSMEYHALNEFLKGASIRQLTLATNPNVLSWISAARKGIADSSMLTKGCGKLLQSIIGYKPTNKKFDSRALYITQRIRKELPDVSPLTDFANELNLSPDRLSHLFRESFDVSIKNYILLEKMRKALLLSLSGVPLTDASLQAGFADAAHFSRSTKNNFSLTPTSISNDINVHIIR
jgi:AraC family transcriptional regulator of arabinose operon